MMIEQVHSSRTWEAKLVVPGGVANDCASFLTIETAKESQTVQLSAGQTRLLLELDSAARVDAEMGIDVPARGWRAPHQIARAVAERACDRIPVESQTIRAYVSRIQRRIREKLSEPRNGHEIPRLFEHKKQIGVRLAPGRMTVKDTGAAFGQLGNVL